MIDFVRGAAMSPNGKSILLIPSTSIDGMSTRIVPAMESGGVVIPRGDVSFVVSEFGAVNLFGKNLQERATAMISLAHPKFRDELFAGAKELGLMTHSRQLGESLRSVYPAGLEETRRYGDQVVTFRPAKPVDDRRIQEHFYNLDKKDVVARFFHEKTSFLRDDVENMFETDYIKNLTILSLTGEFGFGNVIGIGAYMLEPKKNIAEVAFSVSRDWQGKGIASVLLLKLAYAAKDNGISGLAAYTATDNTSMIKLFKKLPWRVKQSLEDGIMILTCNFEEPAEDIKEVKNTGKSSCTQ
jgi:GNAT superfamily N-acetyltransferase